MTASDIFLLILVFIIVMSISVATSRWRDRR